MEVGYNIKSQIDTQVTRKEGSNILFTDPVKTRTFLHETGNLFLDVYSCVQVDTFSGKVSTDSLDKQRNEFERHDWIRNNRIGDEDILQTYNRILFSDIKDIIGHAVFGETDGLKAKIDEIRKKYYHSGQKEKLQRYDRNEKKAFYAKRLATVQDYEEIIHVEKSLKQIEDWDNYLENSMQYLLHQTEVFSKEVVGNSPVAQLTGRVVGWCEENKADAIKTADQIVKGDEYKNFYLPQLNMTATVKEKAGGSIEGLYLHGSPWTIIPLSRNIIVVPVEKMFSARPESSSFRPPDLPDPNDFESPDDFVEKILHPDYHPDPHEVITFPVESAFPEEEELRIILEGLDPKRMTRGQLLDRGIVMVNLVGEGTKPIIDANAEINGATVDFSKLAFITKEQFDALVEEERKELDRLGIDPQKVAAHMLRTLYRSYYNKQKGISEEGDPQTARGKGILSRAELYAGGVRAIKNTPCPILSCSARDARNVDITVGNRFFQSRLNPIVALLAAHGISEKGRGREMDQNYMSIQGYFESFMK